NPIGLSNRNRDALAAEFNVWADQAKNFPGIDANSLSDFNRRLFGNDFLFAVSRDDVASCDIPMLIMPGDDLVHPGEISAEIAELAPHAEMLTPWKGAAHKAAAIRRVKDFFIAHRPR